MEFELVVETEHEEYDPNDARWLNQKRELASDLQRDVGGVRREVTSVPGTKGGIESFVITLGPALIGAVASVFRVWLATDRKRVLKVTQRKKGGRTTTWELSGARGAELQKMVAQLQAEGHE